MTLFDVFPDSEATVTAIVRASLAGVMVSTDLSVDAEAPAVSVRRIGGIPAVRQRLDAADIQLDVWGSSKAEAHDLAQQARRSLMEAEGTTVSYGDDSGLVTGVEDLVGLAWLPDPTTARDRYTFTVRVFTHSA